MSGYDSNRFARLVASIFLQRKKATAEDVEEMSNRLLNVPRFRNISNDDMDALERNPRMLAQKLLQYSLLSNMEKADVLVIQNEARRLLDAAGSSASGASKAKRQLPEAPLPAASRELVLRTSANIYTMPRITPTVKLQIDASGALFGGNLILLPSTMFAQITETMLKEELPYVLAELRTTEHEQQQRFFAKIGESQTLPPDEDSTTVEVSAELAAALGPLSSKRPILFRIVSRLPVVERIVFRNLAPASDGPVTPEMHDTLQLQFESLPGVSVGQRFGSLAVARLLQRRGGDDDEQLVEIAYGKLPIFEGHVPYEIEAATDDDDDDVKRVRVLARCAGCYSSGTHVAYVECDVRANRVRRFCNARCQRMAHL